MIVLTCGYRDEVTNATCTAHAGDGGFCARHGGALTADFGNAFPDGSRDTSSFEDIEFALDMAGAPSMAGAQWLTLPERITAARDAALREAAAVARGRLLATNNQGEEYGWNEATRAIAAAILGLTTKDSK